MNIENIRWVLFDIKITRQDFENACWHRQPGKLDIKRRETGILFISLQTDTLFKLAFLT